MTELNQVVGSGQDSVGTLADGFAAMLSVFNELVRDIRGAGIEVRQQVLLDYTIFIDEGSADLFMEHFGHLLRSIRYVPAGSFTCNLVTVRGVDVAWYTSVREQEK